MARNKIKILGMRYRIIFILSLLYFSGCKCREGSSFSQEDIQRSWKENKKILFQTILPDDWIRQPIQEFSYYDIQGRVDIEEDMYKKILEYEPISLSSIQWKNTERPENTENEFKIYLFNFKDTLHAFGAYSRIRKPDLPLYVHKGLTHPSQGVYLVGKLILFRSHFLWIIRHAVTDLVLLEKIVDSISKQVRNEELKHPLLDALPQSNRIPRSEYYKKENFSDLPYFKNCVSAKYDPHESINIFICASENPDQSNKSFSSYKKYLSSALALEEPSIKRKRFIRQERSIHVEYFSYTTSSYELSSLFKHGQYIFGIKGTNSQKYAFAIANQIMDKIGFQ